MVLHQILTGDLPRMPQPETCNARMILLKEELNPRKAAPEALAKITTECLDPKPEGRPTALQILAVALKSDTSEPGLRRSESFWETLAAVAYASENPKTELVSQTVRYFATEYLYLMSDTTFSAKEACLIMSLIATFCRGGAYVRHANSLSRNFTGELEHGTIFHALASLSSRDRETCKLAWEVTKWPSSKLLSSLVLRKTKSDLLPSTLAALRGSTEQAIALSQLE